MILTSDAWRGPRSCFTWSILPVGFRENTSEPSSISTLRFSTPKSWINSVFELRLIGCPYLISPSFAETYRKRRVQAVVGAIGVIACMILGTVYFVSLQNKSSKQRSKCELVHSTGCPDWFGRRDRGQRPLSGRVSESESLVILNLSIFGLWRKRAKKSCLDGCAGVSSAIFRHGISKWV
jgi:hypothetical protein